MLIKYKNMEDRFEYFFKEDLLRKFYIIHEVDMVRVIASVAKVSNVSHWPLFFFFF